ncbi:MAG: V-type ATPase subunit, partial [Oscillospiraceae bacterium]
MPSDSYPFAVGRVKLLENGLLDRSKLARLNELTLPEAVRALSDWGYAADYPVKNDIDGMVAFRRRELRSVIDEVTPDKELTDLFYLETDATNFKLLLKYRMLGGYGFDHADLQSGLFPI